MWPLVYMTTGIFQCMFTELLFLQAAGVSLKSNMFQPIPPYTQGPFIGRPGLPGPGEFQYTLWYKDVSLSYLLIFYAHLVQSFYYQMVFSL